jgi:DNA-binding NtrC family response regulator
MGHEKRILIVSRDVRVLQTRKLILGAYFDVYPAGRVGEAIRYLSENSFHLIILCYSLSGKECQQILNAVQSRGVRAPVMMITPKGCSSNSVAKALQVPMDEGPLALLRSAAEVLGFEIRTRGRLVNAWEPQKTPQLAMEKWA